MKWNLTICKPTTTMKLLCSKAKQRHFGVGKIGDAVVSWKRRTASLYKSLGNCHAQRMKLQLMWTKIAPLYVLETVTVGNGSFACKEQQTCCLRVVSQKTDVKWYTRCVGRMFSGIVGKDWNCQTYCLPAKYQKWSIQHKTLKNMGQADNKHALGTWQWILENYEI